MRSKYSEELKLERESVLNLDKICLDLGWKYRDLPLDNDVDGEIEIFNEDSITEASFVKIQLKATKNIDKKENGVVFKAPVKLLNFASECNQPLVLCLYDAIEKKFYWIWLQDYIFRVLNFENPKWFENKNSVSIKIPLLNTEDNFEIFLQEIKEIASNGIKEILQLKKIKKYDKFVHLEEEDDISTGVARRISLKYSVEESLSNSKRAMEIILREIININKHSNYYRNSLVEERHSDEIDFLWVFFYTKGFSNGTMPFFKALWGNPDKERFSPIKFEETFHLNKNVTVSWSNLNFDFERMRKGEYVKSFKEVYEKFFEAYNLLHISFARNSINEEKFKEFIDDCDFLKKYEFLGGITGMKLPPKECEELNQKLSEFTNSIDNIKITMFDSSRDYQNKKFLAKMYLKSGEELVPVIEYLRNKVGC